MMLSVGLVALLLFANTGNLENLGQETHHSQLKCVPRKVFPLFHML